MSNILPVRDITPFGKTVLDVHKKLMYRQYLLSDLILRIIVSEFLETNNFNDQEIY